MEDNQPKFIAFCLLIADLALLNITYWSLTNIYGPDHFELISYASLIVNIGWLVVERALSIYDARYLINADHICKTLLNAACVHIVITTFVFYSLNFNISRLFIFKFYTTFVILALISRTATRYFLKYLSRSGYVYKRVAIIGANKEGNFLRKHFESDNTFGIKFMGFITEKNLPTTDGSLGTIACIRNIIDNYEIDEIYWALPLDKEDLIRSVISLCDSKMIRFHTVPQFLAFPFKNLRVNYQAGIPIMHLREEPLESLINRVLKRCFDITISLVVIIFILSWLTPVVGLIIILTSPGPIFFTQKRTGKNNHDFKMIKFRTMRMNDQSDTTQATKGDSRVTPFGRFLRRTSIDELPQFFNSLIGDMSIVGPRPHMLKHTEDYSKLINQFMVRHYIKSGITGWAQVNGARGETDTVEKMKKRVELDIWYLESWSLILDIRICFKTIWTIIKGENSY